MGFHIKLYFSKHALFFAKSRRLFFRGFDLFVFIVFIGKIFCFRKRLFEF